MTHSAKTENTNVTRKPPRWLMRYRSVKRLAMWHTVSKSLPLYLVTEFPKSGGTWYSQMLADCLDLPFARNNNPPKFESCILHGVFLHNRRFHNVSCVLRDGRDVMVSSYYHFLFHNNANLPFGVEAKRKHLGFKDYDDIQTNLPRFIEYMFTDFTKSFGFRCSWASFVNSWKERDATFVKYEDLLSDGVSTMVRAVTELTGEQPNEQKVSNIVEAYSFEKLTGRKRGQIEKGNFIRKGIAGDWKNHFTLESRQAFHSLAGKELIDLGYEANDSWVGQSVAADTSRKEKVS